MKPLNQGNWIQELKQAKNNRKDKDKKFVWDKEVAVNTKQDKDLPKADIEGKAAPAAPAPTSDIPRKITGQIDNRKLKSDLVSEMKSQQKFKR